MGQQLIKSASKDKKFKIISLTENKAQRKKILGILPRMNNPEAFEEADIIIDFTVPKCTLEVLKIAVKQKKRVVVIDDVVSSGTTMRKTVQHLRESGAEVKLCLVLANKTEMNDIDGVPLRGLVRVVTV